MGWGKYYSVTEQNEQNTIEAEQKRMIESRLCPNMDRSTRGNFIIYDHINISFAVQMHPDNSCSQIDSEAYLTMMYQEIFRELKPNDIICRVADCIRARLLAVILSACLARTNNTY